LVVALIGPWKELIMNQKKKTTMWRALLGLLLLAAPTAVQAQYGYSINAGGTTVTITNYTGPGGAVTIPTNINGLIVTSIGEEAFFENYSLSSVTIPGSVTVIGQAAFDYCTNLTSVTMTNGLASVGGYVFRYCYSLTNLTIPGSVTNIGEDAFGFNPFLTSVTIPGGTFSGPYDFSYVFGYDSNLTNVTIANGVTSIADGLFGGMYGGDNQITSVSIPASVTNIAEYAFNECYGLTSVTLSYGLTSIGTSAFGYCYDLTNITIPASVTNIEANAFTECGDLVGVFFLGNAPSIPVSSPPFNQSETIYYLPGTTGWSNTFSGRPTVLWNPQIQAGGASFGVQSNRFGFNITGTSNIPMVVEACTNLASPVWTPLQSLTLTNGLVYFSEPLQTNSSGRY
jgi:hypothetical protein